MADLWQAYGGWLLYALFFAAFVWVHMRMHGSGAHGCGHAGHSHADRRVADQGEPTAARTQESGDAPRGAD